MPSELTHVPRALDLRSAQRPCCAPLGSDPAQDRHGTWRQPPNQENEPQRRRQAKLKARIAASHRRIQEEPSAFWIHQVAPASLHGPHSDLRWEAGLLAFARSPKSVSLRELFGDARLALICRTSYPLGPTYLPKTDLQSPPTPASRRFFRPLGAAGMDELGDARLRRPSEKARHRPRAVGTVSGRQRRPSPGLLAASPGKTASSPRWDWTQQDRHRPSARLEVRSAMVPRTSERSFEPAPRLHA